MNKKILTVVALALLPALCGIAKADEAQADLSFRGFDVGQNVGILGQAPVTKVGHDDIVVRPLEAPVWMVNGADDPRVPRSEAAIRVDVLRW